MLRANQALAEEHKKVKRNKINYSTKNIEFYKNEMNLDKLYIIIKTLLLNNHFPVISCTLLDLKLC